MFTMHTFCIQTLISMIVSPGQLKIESLKNNQKCKKNIKIISLFLISCGFLPKLCIMVKLYSYLQTSFFESEHCLRLILFFCVCCCFCWGGGGGVTHLRKDINPILILELISDRALKIEWLTHNISPKPLKIFVNCQFLQNLSIYFMRWD